MNDRACYFVLDYFYYVFFLLRTNITIYCSRLIEIVVLMLEQVGFVLYSEYSMLIFTVVLAFDVIYIIYELKGRYYHN